MPEWSSSFQQTYCRFDRRVLGVFRWGLSATLLYDLARRFPDAGLLWSSEGLLSGATLERAPQVTPQWSFLFWLESAAAVQGAFLALGVVFALYGAGLFTRPMQVLALLGYASLNARNVFFEDGGTCSVTLLLTWTLLLPLGERFSLDALVRDARKPSIEERCRAREDAAAPLFTLAALAVLLQASAIYWLNAAHKSGSTWRAGDAVHLVLWQHRVNTTWAVWFAAHEPTWFSPLASWLTKRTEFVLPVLLLWPTHLKLTRSLAFVLALLLHGGIALALTLGPFSYAMICLLWLAVPGSALDLVAERLPARPFWALARLRGRAVRGLRRRFFEGKPAPAELSAYRQTRRAKLREAAIACMLVVETSNVLSSNRAVPKALRPTNPDWFLAYKPYLRGWQGWSMFAPEAPRDDGTMVLDALTTSGRHIDPFTGVTPNFEQIRVGVAPHSIALSDYFFAMRDKNNARYRANLARYLKAYRTPSGGEALRSAEVWWVSYVPPARGSYVPGPLKKEKLWRVRL